MAESIILNPTLKSRMAQFKGTVFRLTLREKVLGLIFVIALLGVWASMQIERHLSMAREYTEIGNNLGVQRIVLDDRENIEARFNAKIAEIDLDALPTRDEVSASIDALVRKRGFNFKTTPPKSDPGAPLTFHGYSASIEGANYEDLIAFTQELRETLPYVSLRRVVVQSQRSNDQLLDAKLELKSIEYTQ